VLLDDADWPVRSVQVSALESADANEPSLERADVCEALVLRGKPSPRWSRAVRLDKHMAARVPAAGHDLLIDLVAHLQPARTVGRDGRSMVLSGYADTRVIEGFQPHWPQHFKSEVRRLREALASDRLAVATLDQAAEQVWDTLTKDRNTVLVTKSRDVLAPGSAPAQPLLTNDE
jgi:hypothetical protein